MVSVHYSEMEALGNRFKYRYAYWTLGSSSVFAEAFEKLIMHNRWTKKALLWFEDDVDSSDISRHIERVFRSEFQDHLFFKGCWQLHPTEWIIRTLCSSYYFIITTDRPSYTVSSVSWCGLMEVIFSNFQWIFKEQIITDFHNIMSFLYNDNFYSCSEADIKLS